MVTGHIGHVKSICWSRDDKRLLSASADGVTYEWNIQVRVLRASNCKYMQKCCYISGNYHTSTCIKTLTSTCQESSRVEEHVQKSCQYIAAAYAGYIVFLFPLFSLFFLYSPHCLYLTLMHFLLHFLSLLFSFSRTFYHSDSVLIPVFLYHSYISHQQPGRVVRERFQHAPDRGRSPRHRSVAGS